MRPGIRLRLAIVFLGSSAGILAVGELCPRVLARPVEPDAHMAISNGVTPEEARAIAREAYIFGFPMVDNYRVMYSSAVDRKSPAFLAPFNQIHSSPRVFTPQDRTIPTPNSDTPYSMLWLDLRAEPIVLTIPAIANDRYFSVQFVDLYTFNLDYLGSRTTGNGGGSYLVIGPNWNGEVPPDFKKVIRAQTEIVLAIYRTQLFEPSDLENVKKIQAGYLAVPLSGFLRQDAPPATAKIEFPAALGPADERKSLEFFNILRFVLQFCPTQAGDDLVRDRFLKIGIVPGQTFDPAGLSAELKQALLSGMADGQKEIDAARSKATGSADFFGTRAEMKNNYLNRAVAAQAGIYGNTKQEALYPLYEKDADGQPLDGGNHTYVLRFEPGQMPPVNAFWSLTMYDLPGQFLVANPLNRYLINSPMLPTLKNDADGGLTFTIQNASPGKDKESNWLPAPSGPFMMAMRLYWPKAEALDGKWKSPPARRVK